MSDALDFQTANRLPTPDRPLAGQNILVVEDSRFACEALKLLCQRSGARIRRADSLWSARRHLAAFRPGVLIVDIGLPDGSGLDLISEVARSRPPVDVILAISGDTSAEPAALAAGAHAFLEKPLSSLDHFQQVILSKMPESPLAGSLRPLSGQNVEPDRLAFQDDMLRIAEIIGQTGTDANVDYIAGFVTGIARSAGDSALEVAAETLANHRARGEPYQGDLARLAGLIQDRLENRRKLAMR